MSSHAAERSLWRRLPKCLPPGILRWPLKHEKSVTARINALCELAAAEKDFASANRLVWFVDEQIEEEENVQGIIDALKLVGDDKVGTFMLDKELAGRVYASPVAG